MLTRDESSDGRQTGYRGAGYRGSGYRNPRGRSPQILMKMIGQGYKAGVTKSAEARATGQS
jgi:hypothetical protein